MLRLAQSSSTAAQRRIPIRCVDATDKITAKTGLTFAAGELKLSKNGAATANHSGTATEIGNGLYYYEATATELDTLGFFSVFVVKSGVMEAAFVAQVIGATSDITSMMATANATAVVAQAGTIADTILQRPSSSWEAAAPVKSLGTAVMKTVHRTRDNAGTLQIYRSDGTTVHASQTVTTDSANLPIDELSGAS